MLCFFILVSQIPCDTFQAGAVIYIFFYMSFDLFLSLGSYRAVTKIQDQLTFGIVSFAFFCFSL